MIKKQIKETWDNVPILARGKVNLTFGILKGLSIGRFLKCSLIFVKNFSTNT